MAEGKGVALTILGVVSVLAIVGLVLLFMKAGAAGGVSAPFQKLYTRGSVDKQNYPYPYLHERSAGGYWYPYDDYPYADWDRFAKEENILPYGTTVAQGRETYGRQPRNIPSIQTCALGSGEPGEIPCPVYRNMQSICLSNLYTEEALRRDFLEVPGSPGCYVPKAI
jgi:hypothetical protein